MACAPFVCSQLIAVVAGLHAVLPAAGHVGGQRVADDGGILRQDRRLTALVDLPERLIEKELRRLGRADALGDEEPVEEVLHTRQSQPVELLLIGAVAGGGQQIPAPQCLQQLSRPVHGDGTLVQGGAEIFLEHHAVEVHVQRGEHVVPPDLLQLRKRQSALLDLPPELVVLAVEHIVHPRLVGPQAEVGEALLHGPADVGVKIQQGVVDVDQNQLHSALLFFSLFSG